MSDCLFCKMVSGEIDVPKVYEDDHLIAINDINPQAPFHILIFPQKHISTLNNIGEADQQVVGRIFLTAKQIAAEKEFDQSGYRVVANCLEAAGQTVFHIHFHLLGGRQMSWPPG